MKSFSSFDEIVVYDFSNLNLQDNSKDNCYGCDNCNTCDNDSEGSSCNDCDTCDNCDSGW